MSRKEIRTNKRDNQCGFTILELIVSIGVISILAGISVPKLGSIITSSKIDEAKALLNTAAVDCLQQARQGTQEINDDIISDKRVNPIGFKIDKTGTSDCSYFQLIPNEEGDSIRFPMGFSVASGDLTKFANPTSTDTSSIKSCERWAGVNCKQDESLKELIRWKLKIKEAKSTCTENYSNWLKNGTQPPKFKRWNSTAEQGCPSRPPKDGSTTYKTSSTCTPNGCNQTIYGFEGKFVGTEKDDYIKARDDKYGTICTEWEAQKAEEKYTNNPIDQPVTKSPECGTQAFWFFEGEDKGSPEGIRVEIDKIAGDKCVADREQARKDGFNGKWGPVKGPGECATEQYICNKTFVTEAKFFLECGSEEEAEPPAKCKTVLKKVDNECLEYELTPFLQQKCGPRPMSQDTSVWLCRNPGKGKPPNNLGGWNKTPQCNAWATCMNLR